MRLPRCTAVTTIARGGLTGPAVAVLLLLLRIVMLLLLLLLSGDVGERCLQQFDCVLRLAAVVDVSNQLLHSLLRPQTLFRHDSVQAARRQATELSVASLSRIFEQRPYLSPHSAIAESIDSRRRFR